MKISQIRTKLIIFLILSISIILFFSPFIGVKAADSFAPFQIEKGSLSGNDLTAGYKIETRADGTEWVVKQGAIERTMNQVKTWAIDEAWKELKKSSAVAFKQSLKKYLNTLAYDMATYIATGDKGQAPMFEVDSFGDFVRNAADDYTGYFIEELGKKGMWGTKFNLCEPDPNVKLTISLGLQKISRPDKPECTFTEMKKNWDEALSDPNFLNDFQDMFNPWSNDLGIALTLQTGMETGASQAAEDAANERLEGMGIKAKTDPVSGKIKTPVTIVREFFYKPIEDSSASEKIFTGSIAADVIDVFLNTLLGKLVDKWLDEGIVTDFFSDSNSADYTYSGSGGGIAAAKERFKSLIEPQFGVRGDYDILAELTMCSDPTKAGPTNCVITDNFRQAIENRLTVGQALTQGYLNTSGIFGFNADGLEPNYNEGYPYRSMIILRKFRILPVGWELAAEYIKDHPAEIDGTKNLGDLVACYSASDDYNGYYANWCDGLVDPTWVLKAPLNYCKREGAGPEIISEQIMGEGYDSELTILRDDTYCADEQSCIQENSDGSCNLYGYCTEERRTWNFNADSCDPIYNTCQTFRSSDGQTISYLENTLDYGICSIDNVGCQAYCQDYDNTTENYTCTESTGDKIYLDSNAEECSAENEGCHEFIRMKPGLGANILTNSGFEDDIDGTIWQGAGTQVYDSYEGSRGLELVSNLSKTITFGPNDYNVAGQYFSLSFYAKDCGLGDNFELGEQETATSLNQAEDWQYYNTAYVYSTDFNSNQVNFSINSDSCVIDAIKLERGQVTTTYSDYRGQGLVYQKLAPDYLSCDGVGDSSACDNFARTCLEDEVGCEMYTSVNDDISVAAKVVAQDYCPSECVGYDTYIQSETIFDSLRDSYFIPTTAQVCGAEAVGCDEFTNLDEVESGGEAREYYSYLRQCIGVNDSQCAEFYTWEGSDESGYQLKVLVLKENQTTGEPALTEDDSTQCNEAIYNLDETDPSYNTDCRQFYNRDGQLSYHLYTRTVSCSDNCHPYRRTEINVDPEIVLSGECVGSDRHWDTPTAQCVVCKNSGEWSDQHQSCIYMAIPGEGMTCAANQAGCREYSGNTGNNMRFVLNDDFEGSLQDWTGVNGTTISLSNESLVVGGNSLEITGSPFTISKTVGQNVFKGNAYVLTFSAKASSASAITSIQMSDSEASTDFTTVNLSNEWQYYEVNLTNLDHDVLSDEAIVMDADGSLYINDIRLTEITDRYYLIKNSWVTPDSCNRNIKGEPSPLYMLGCEAYYDRENDIHNLHNFDYLCGSSAVGCELMIDTHNYSDYQSEVFNENDDSEITVLADNYSYIVYDSNKQCNQDDKGCQKLGEPYQYEDDLLYSDKYLKNNPDKYNEILCEAEAVGCQEWTSTDGTNYFKDPGDMVCQWRQAADTTEQGWGWYKKKIKRCNGNDGDVCLVDNDCSDGQTCQMETEDISCATTYWKTFGYGGQESRIYQPGGDWTGLCSASQAGCTEYIDPVSQFSSNIIFNNNLASPQDVDSNGIPDGWISFGGGFSQEVSANPYTLYRLSRNSLAGNISLTCNNNIYTLGSNNILSSGATTISLSDENYNSSKLIYISNNESCVINVSSASGQIGLAEAVIDYQLKEDIDKQSCNGIIDFEDGCVLFNERDSSGSSLSGLTWDADLTISDQSGVTPLVGEESNRDANVIIKVTPDRICDKWLACRSYIKDENDNNVCFDIGLCNSVDPNGNCNSFLTIEKENQIYPVVLDNSDIANMTGYAKVGYSNGSMVSDYYSFGAMEQEGEMTNVANSGFEIAGSNGYPIGWIWEGGTWNASVFKVINNPIETQTEGLGYAPEGQNFLKLGSSYNAISEFVDVVGGTANDPIEYIVTAYINTLNLKSGSAKIKIGLYDSAGNHLADASMNPEITLEPGHDWIFKLGRFNISSTNVSRIKIILYSDIGTEGNYYFDDIKIKPALNSRDSWYTPQSCRLYPQTDSLSCDYYDNSGKRQKGWSGYCLEYDRYPGSDDACLLWWPVDKVKGEGVEEGAGYIGKVPVYYCTGFQSGILVEARKAIWASGSCSCRGYGDDDEYNLSVCEGYGCEDNIPNGYHVVGTGHESGCGHDCPGGGLQNARFHLYPDSEDFVVASDGYDWYKYDGDLQLMVGKETWDEANPDLRLYNPDDGNLYDPRIACTKVVQTVTTIGQNKYWSGRVYEGSDYETPLSSREYSTRNSPFGSMQPPSPVNNPYEWDGILNTEDDSSVQPVYITVDSDLANAGTPYGCLGSQCDKFGVCSISRELCYRGGLEASGDNLRMPDESLLCNQEEDCEYFSIRANGQKEVKGLFAQSYGTWEWDNNLGRYKISNGQDWGPPDNLCYSDATGPDCLQRTGSYSRPAFPCDYCAILPRIENIRVNNKKRVIGEFDGFIELTKSQFVKLTFNSIVDSQQLPVVMYAIDWGDGEETVVTGVEMRARPDESNPHSLYHLYSYWDLKAKDASGVSDIDCSVEGECRVKPKIKIKDNWGWCNGGTAMNDCDQWVDFSSWIVVKEK